MKNARPGKEPERAGHSGKCIKLHRAYSPRHYAGEVSGCPRSGFVGGIHPAGIAVHALHGFDRMHSDSLKYVIRQSPPDFF